MISIVGYVLVCWLAADFLSGLFHWWEDRYADERWPIIGPLVAAPNRVHHADQTAFLAGGYWQRNSTTIIPAIIAAAIVALFNPWLSLPFVVVSQANELHCWAHQRCNRFIRVLQATGLVIDCRQHSEHHRFGHDRRYCTMTNVLNPILDEVGIWEVLESFATIVFQAEPRHEGYTPPEI